MQYPTLYNMTTAVSFDSYYLSVNHTENIYIVIDG